MKKYKRLDSIGYLYEIVKGERLFNVIVGLEMADSNKESKQLIRSGGVSVDNVPVEDIGLELNWGTYVVSVGSGQGLVKSGKAAKRYAIKCRI